jgi:hypothetical protein
LARQRFVLFELRDRRRGADLQLAAGLDGDAGEFVLQRQQVDDAFRSLQALLHAIDQVDARALEHGVRLLARFARFGQRLRHDIGEWFHRLIPSCWRGLRGPCPE